MAFKPLNLHRLDGDTVVFVVDQEFKVIQAATLTREDIEEEENYDVISLPDLETDGYGYRLFYFSKSTRDEIIPEDDPADGPIYRLMVNYEPIVHSGFRRYTSAKNRMQGITLLAKQYNITGVVTGIESKPRFDNKNFWVQYKYTSKLFD